MEDTVQDKLIRLEQNYEKLNEQVEELNDYVHRLNRRVNTLITEAADNPRDVHG